MNPLVGLLSTIVTRLEAHPEQVVTVEFRAHLLVYLRAAIALIKRDHARVFRWEVGFNQPTRSGKPEFVPVRSGFTSAINALEAKEHLEALFYQARDRANDTSLDKNDFVIRLTLFNLDEEIAKTKEWIAAAVAAAAADEPLFVEQAENEDFEDAYGDVPERDGGDA
jgi:hypothetical protein